MRLYSDGTTAAGSLYDFQLQSSSTGAITRSSNTFLGGGTSSSSLPRTNLHTGAAFSASHAPFASIRASATRSISGSCSASGTRAYASSRPARWPPAVPRPASIVTRQP